MGKLSVLYWHISLMKRVYHRGGGKGDKQKVGTSTKMCRMVINAGCMRVTQGGNRNQIWASEKDL